jgi:adenylate kinase family enzyme
MGCDSSSTINKKIIFIIGKPGSGQKSQSIYLKNQIHNCDIIQVEALIRYEMLIKSSMKLDQINEDKLVSSEDLVNILNDKIKYLPSEFIIIEAFPKSESNITEWKKIIGKNLMIHSLIYLKIDNDDKLFEREVDKITAMCDYYVHKRLNTFNQHTLPIINYLKDKINYIEIDAEKNEEDVKKEIWTKFNEINKKGKFNFLV